jgi:hypothetical protein
MFDQYVPKIGRAAAALALACCLGAADGNGGYRSASEC